MKRASLPPTADDISKAEHKVLVSIREGGHVLADILREAATLQVSQGVTQERAVKRALQQLKARGVIESRGSRWYEVGLQLKRAQYPTSVLARFASRPWP